MQEKDTSLAHKKTTGLRHTVEALAYTAAGFKAAYKYESAVRQEVVVFSVLIPAAFWLGSSAVETAYLITTCLFIVMAEIMNAAVESVVDRIGAEYHELSGRAKDLASAAVYVGWINLIITWPLFIFDRFF